MDPQQRLFLECCWQAIEDAGYVPDTYAGQIGVYAGSSVWSYFLTRFCNTPGFIQRFTAGYQVSNYFEMMGNSLDFLSTRVSYKLNLRGPSFTMQSACSTFAACRHAGVSVAFDLPERYGAGWGCLDYVSAEARLLLSGRRYGVAGRSRSSIRRRCPRHGFLAVDSAWCY